MVVGTFAACAVVEKETEESKAEQWEVDESEVEKESEKEKESETEKESDEKESESDEKESESDEKESNTNDGGNTEDGGNENEEPEEEPLVESTAGLKFELNADGKSYTLVGIGICTATEIVIDGYKGLPVTSIGSYAFRNCDSLTSVTIGNGVTSIGEHAFAWCTSLTSVTIGNSVTSIGSYAFYNTVYYNNSSNWENGVLYIGKYLIDVKNDISGAYTVKEETKLIANSAFEDCTSLTSVTIPNSVTSIGKRAFYNTAYYNDSSNWENEVLYIGKYLIAAKTYISGAYTVKEETRLIAASAFYNCTGLTSVTIPNSVTSIDYSAFNSCTGLTSVTIGNNVTSIGNGAFRECSSLTSVTIGNGVTSIGSSAFSGCTGLTSVTIPNSVTSIGNYAFSSCDSLTSVTIGSGVTSIGNYAFAYCFNLTSIKYRGIEAEWNAITKGSSWNYNVPSSCVITYNYTGE